MAWRSPEISRLNGQLSVPAGGERAVADAWLDAHRETLLWKCGGLTAGQLRSRCVEPSSLSLLGLLRHMAEVERDWFRTRFAGERVPYLYCTDDDLSAEFDVDGADAEADHATYLAELDAVRRTVAGRSLDETFTDPRRGITMSLRWVYTLMIQEYARHNGHADLLRERLDGATGH
ncbi:putative damage-inducible protein DinB [Nonomuraea thailandensis]|uniref:Damage-inducible protein DinB n=1 Tax=Nonomuraea thailandensis TaxID=1188745 RepID=A0A9X2K6X5_9ACTN|nr:DinB family protein [Nonomuraea thailandensis]MCP2362573.1 putative damage-inducible protein DinB [Nonomuraea thailandensis]